MNKLIDPSKFGVSYSLKMARSFGMTTEETLGWLVQDAGFRRFRLMSYWDEHEKTPGEYNFFHLDKQVKMIAEAGGVITLCLGARQPRWPENHWPDWAWELSKAERTKALLRFIEEVVRRYRDNPAIISYQLENEALLKDFGRRPEVDRHRLRDEFKLVKLLDPTRPIIMSTSTSWGIPLRQPIPDIVGFSYYQITYDGKRKRYSTAFHKPWMHRLRAALIRLLWRKPVFIHELQMEPWGPHGAKDMSFADQDKSMGPPQIAKNLHLARTVNHYPIDLWGGEWWYWRHKNGDDSIWQAVQKSIQES
ncbi:MAG TPA: beta-galactosidase [Candidatus Saccharimonadales bacterium]